MISSWLGEFISNTMPDGPVKDMLVDGVIGGVGAVIVFLPQILILYFFISYMEDSGYMARAAFIMDKLMHKMGLHGKSFIPLIMGFGCNVPAVMATRTIKASIAITIVSSISFFGFLVGPPVIGWLAEATGLRIAISIAACLGLMIAFVAAKVGKRIS